MSGTLYVARHGETTWNRSGRYQGRLESTLSDLGIAQALALADYFGGLQQYGETAPSHVFSSPLLRCTETAQAVADRLRLAVRIDNRLIEIAHGTWEGRYRDELAAHDPERYRAWRHDPERVAFERGETLGNVCARWRSFAATLPQAMGDVVVVTHDAVCRVALLDAMSLGLADFWNVHVENGGFSRISFGQSAPCVLEECHTQHLSTLRASLEKQAL